MTRYKVKVDSNIGPLIAISSGKNLTDALNRLKGDMKGVTDLIEVISETKI